MKNRQVVTIVRIEHGPVGTLKPRDRSKMLRLLAELCEPDNVPGCLVEARLGRVRARLHVELEAPGR